MTEQSFIAGTATMPAAYPKPLTAEALAYATNVRKISRATLVQLNVGSDTAFFPELNRETDCVVFPYEGTGGVHYWKAAAFPLKAFTSMKGGTLQFWNLARVIGSPTVYIVEGEWDALSLIEAGIPANQVVSVPNGARARKADSDPSELRGFAYVNEAQAAGLNRTKRFVWCGDSDGPGRALRADMGQLLGAARFYFVEWPEGVKDANDMLRADGPQALRDLVTQGALPWPIDGLYRLSELPEPPPLTLWQPGFLEWESKVMLAPRTLSVFTGHPGHGKTTLSMQMWFQICRAYDLAAGIASFETHAKPHHRRALRQFHAGKLERNMSDAETRAADAWIEEHFLWMAHPEHRPTLEWFLDKAEAAVVRQVARIIQLDPWNRLEASRDH